jgi:hypothetical protein
VKSLRVICMLALAIIQLAILAFFLSALPEGGLPFDDAWIHLVFARNLAEQGRMGFNSCCWSGGSTSPLWDFLLAIGYRLSGNMLAIAYILGSFCYLLTSFCLFLFLDKIFDGLEGGYEASLMVVICFAITGYIPYLALSGMDTLLFLGLSLGSLVSLVHKKYLLSGWLLAALILTRIEGLGLASLLCLVTGIRAWYNCKWRYFVNITAPVIVALAFYLLFNRIITGSYLPTTMLGRKWLWGLSENLWAFDLHRTQRFFLDWINLIRAFVLADGGWGRTLFVGISGMIGVIALMRKFIHSTEITLLVGWVLIHNLAYIFLAPVAYLRYQSPNLILIPVLLMSGWLWLVQIVRPCLRRWLVLGTGTTIIFSFLPGTIAYRQVFVWNVTHINQVHVNAGKWISKHLPENAVVAAFDIGAIKYFSNRQVLDLGGLIDPDFVHNYLYPGRVVDYLHENRVRYLVMPEPYSGQADLKSRLGFYKKDQAAKIQLHPLITFEIAPYIKPPFTLNKYQFYTAYLRINIYEIKWLYH